MPPAQPGRFRNLFLCAAGCGIVFYCLAIFCAGCGSPGEPTPPSPPIPATITDLAARQYGDAVQLIFSLPSKTVNGVRLTEAPTCEIYRGEYKSDGTLDGKSFHMVYTVPGTLVSGDVVDKQVQILVPLSPEEIKAHPGAKLAYMVRTRVSTRKGSADSNIVALAAFPVPEAVSNIAVSVTESAVELRWPAVQRTTGGEALPAVTYRVYRGQLDAATDQAAMDAAVKDLAHAKLKSKLALLASPESNSYRDTDFEFDQKYVYVVRSVATAGGAERESGDSVPVIVAPKDTFPPAAPQGLVAATLAGTAPGSAVVELSWSISPENDVAGYRVYRSERENERGEAVTPDLVPTPALRDAAVQTGHHYWYSVTAVDRAGNESTASPQILVEVAQPSS
jgi:hypothetical protein